MISVDPHTLKVDTSDFTFAKSEGKCMHHGIEASRQVPFGCCFACDSPHLDNARAGIDLVGTPYAIDDEFTYSTSSLHPSSALLEHHNKHKQEQNSTTNKNKTTKGTTHNTTTTIRHNSTQHTNNTIT